MLITSDKDGPGESNGERSRGQDGGDGRQKITLPRRERCSGRMALDTYGISEAC